MECRTEGEGCRTVWVRGSVLGSGQREVHETEHLKQPTALPRGSLDTSVSVNPRYKSLTENQHQRGKSPERGRQPILGCQELVRCVADSKGLAFRGDTAKSLE